MAITSPPSTLAAHATARPGGGVVRLGVTGRGYAFDRPNLRSQQTALTAKSRPPRPGVLESPRPYWDADGGVFSGPLALTALSITCQTSWSSRFSFQMPYAVPSSTGGTATSPIAPLIAASTHS